MRSCRGARASRKAPAGVQGEHVAQVERTRAVPVRALEEDRRGNAVLELVSARRFGTIVDAAAERVGTLRLVAVAQRPADLQLESVVAAGTLPKPPPNGSHLGVD